MKHGNPDHRQIKPSLNPTAAENQKTTFQQRVAPLLECGGKAQASTPLLSPIGE